MEHAAALAAPAPFPAEAAGWEAVRPLAEAAIADAAAGADVVARFESAIAERVGAARAVAVRSGPAALELLLRAIGVEPGDEVVVPAFGDVATASAVVRAGGRPVFADIGPDDLALDAAAAAAAVTARTRALLVARPGHRPADLDALGAVADRFALSLVEDTAALTAAADSGAAISFAPDAPLGALGDAGAIVTDDERVADTAAVLSGLGHLGGRALPAVAAEAVLPGANCPMDDVQAAVLLAKLTRLDADTARRAELARAYTERLAGVVDTPAECADPVHACYLVGVERRAELAEHLAAHGVATEVRYPLAVPAQPCFARLGHRAGAFPAAEAAAARLIALPLHPDLADSAVDRVCDLVLAFHGRPS